MLSITKSRLAGKTLIQTLFSFLLVQQICLGQGTWTKIGDMPEIRYAHTADEINGKVYITGGVNTEQGAYPTTMLVYEKATSTWTTIPLPGNSLRGQHTSCVVDSNLYVIGGGILLGGTVNSTAQMYMFKPSTSEWIAKDSMPTDRQTLACALLDGKIYVAGGLHVINGVPNYNGLKTFEVYDLATETWSTLPDMPTYRWGLSVVAFEGKIYVLGGRGISLRPTAVDVFDPQDSSWTTVTNIPTPRYQLATCVVDSNIYAIDGWYSSGSGPIYDTVEVYNPITYVWTTGTSMPVAVAMLDGYALDGKIYMYGGSYTTHPNFGISDIWEFTPQLIPVAPSNLIAEAYDFSVNLTWQDNSVNELGFIIQRKYGDTSSVDPFITIDTVATDVTAYLDTGLIPNTLYTYRVCAYNLAGNSAFTNQLEVITTPVELTSFTAISNGNSVILNWSTATETNNQGFSIERKSSGSEYSEIGFVPGFGTTTEPKSYSYTDSNVLEERYTYRLKQIDFDGSCEYSPEVEVEVAALMEFTLKQNYPNPFNPSTVISYQLPASGEVTLNVYDILGNNVATLVNEFEPAGSYEVDFNAVTLPSGVYFYRLKAGEFISTKKMILLK